MKNFSSGIMILLGIGLLYLSLKKDPDNWLNILLITFLGIPVILLILYFLKKRIQ